MDEYALVRFFTTRDIIVAPWLTEHCSFFVPAIISALPGRIFGGPAVRVALTAARTCFRVNRRWKSPYSNRFERRSSLPRMTVGTRHFKDQWLE
jgi:hypothetical protein